MEIPQINSDDQHFYSSFVMEYIVPNTHEQPFRQWFSQLVQAAQQYAGYTRTDLCPPLDCQDGVVKWYSVVHFDTPQNLKHWLESDIRKQLLQEGHKSFVAYRYKSFTTGLEGWFSRQFGESEQSSLGPPAWKQVLAVVLGLYPTIVIQGMLFTALGIMRSWSYPSSLVINNLITSSILTWLVMPLVTRFLRFWLRPAYRLTTRKTDWLGAALVLGALGFMVSLFNYLDTLS